MKSTKEEPLSDYTFQKESVRVKHPRTQEYHQFLRGQQVPEWCLGEDAEGNPVMDEAHWTPPEEEETDEISGDYSKMKKETLLLLAGDRGVSVSEGAVKADIIAALEANDRKNS